MTSKKSCFVPGCKQTRKSIPEKLFFHVPQGDMGKKWCQVARRDPLSVSSHEWCCQDHFNLEDDVQDWFRYKVLKQAGLKTFRLRLRRNVVPHIFSCQPGRRGTNTKSTRAAAAKRQRAEIIENLMQEIKEAEPTFYLSRETELIEPSDVQLEHAQETEESSDFMEEHVNFDYQDSLWAPYCDENLQENLSMGPTDLQTENIQKQQTEVSMDSLTDGTYFILQVHPSAEDNDLETEETCAMTSQIEKLNTLSSVEAKSNFWNWKVLECSESDGTDIS